MTDTINQIELIYNDLFRYARHFCRTRENVEDLVQDTCYKALQHSDQYDPNKGNIRTWLYRIMRNCYIDDYRKRKAISVSELTDGDPLFVNEMNPYNYYRINEVLNAVSELPYKQKNAILMTVQGYKYKEIAEKMNSNLNQIKIRIFRGRNKLLNLK